MSAFVAGSKLPSMAGTMTRSMSGWPSYMPQVGISPQNFSTPLLGAALSDRSVPSVRFAQERVLRAHDGSPVLVDDGRLRGHLEGAAATGLDEAHGLAVVRLAAQEEERPAPVVHGRAVGGMQADGLHAQRQHRHDDLLQRPGRPGAREGHDAPVVA